MEEKMDELIEAINSGSGNSVIDYILIIVPILISIFALVVSVQTTRKQNKLQNDEFCFQLFERRLQTYDALKSIISRTVTNGKVSNSDLSDFISEKKDVPFLFGTDVCEIYEKIYHTMANIHTLGIQIDHNIKLQRQTDNHERLCDNEADRWDELFALTDELYMNVKKYISFAEYKIEKD